MPAQTQDVRGAVKEFLREQLHIELAGDAEDLLSTGWVDSLGVVELLAFLEEHFGIRIELDRLDLDELRSVDAISRLVDRHRNPATGGL